jgi:hypothetical protein
MGKRIGQSLVGISTTNINPISRTRSCSPRKLSKRTGNRKSRLRKRNEPDKIQDQRNKS